MKELESLFKVKTNYFNKWFGIDLENIVNISYDIKFRCLPSYNIYDVILELGPYREANFLRELVSHKNFIAICGIDSAATFFFDLPLEFREELEKVTEELSNTRLAYFQGTTLKDIDIYTLPKES